MANEPDYELKFGRNGPFDRPLVIEEDDEAIAELDVRVGPEYHGAVNVEMNEAVCTKVFDGHHWRESSLRLEHHQRTRTCVLCDKKQQKVDRWVDAGE